MDKSGSQFDDRGVNLGGIHQDVQLILDEELCYQEIKHRQIETRTLGNLH